MKIDFVKIKRIVMQYAFAVVWTAILVSFAYHQLIFNFLSENRVAFETKLIEIHSSFPMLLVSVGLVFMLYVDSYIQKVITNAGQIDKHLVLLLFFAVMLAIALTVFARMEDLAKWVKLSCVFGVFILILIIYKAHSLASQSGHAYCSANEY